VEGRTAWLESLAEVRDAWERMDFTPSFLIDSGDQVATLGSFTARGAASSIDIEERYAQVIDIGHGLAARERDFNDWVEGLRAGGFEGEVLARLETLAPGEPLEL
jgi:hypothetical protein